MDTDKKTVMLNIGQLIAVKQPTILRTLLGSCVSTCLFDSVARVAGMNHILLAGRADFKNFDDAARYGVNAMELLINEMSQLGALRSRLQAKVFGGGHVLAGINPETSPGVKNVEFVIDYLNAEGMRIVSRDTGGPFTRIIHFHSDTFDVFVKKVKMASAAKILEAEEKLKHKVEEKIEEKMDVTLFD